MVYYVTAKITIKHLEIQTINNFTSSSKIKIIEGLGLICENYIKAKSVEEAKIEFKRLFLDTLNKNTYETLYIYCDRNVFNEYVKVPFWQQVIDYKYKANDIDFQFIIDKCTAIETLANMTMSELINEIKDILKNEEERK